MKKDGCCVFHVFFISNLGDGELDDESEEQEEKITMALEA
jgi:hypothetical protein